MGAVTFHLDVVGSWVGSELNPSSTNMAWALPFTLGRAQEPKYCHVGRIDGR